MSLSKSSLLLNNDFSVCVDNGYCQPESCEGSIMVARTEKNFKRSGSFAKLL